MPVAESLGLAALGWVASPIVAKLLNEGFTFLGINMQERVEKLEMTILPVFEAVIEKADGSEHRSKVEKWLQRLKDAYDGAEDALDLLDYRRLERQAIKAAACSASSNTRPTIPLRIPIPIPIRVRSLFRSRPLPRPVKSVIKGGRDVLSPRKIKLRRKLNKLEKIAGEAEKLRALLDTQPQTAVPDRQTISLPPPKVFGRDEDREEIIRLLKIERPATGEPGSAGIPIIAIVGRPGVGKTTLAQCICEKLRVEDPKHFDPVMWVYASCNFKLDEIMKDIIQQASIAADLPTTESHQVLQQTMTEKLKLKKFLLVIDDVWCDGDAHVNSWDTLLRCLSKCLPGSKILVTAQSDDAPRKIAKTIGATTEKIYNLKELKGNDFLDLFFYYALPSEGIDSDLREELKKIGEKIARKLNEDPTAAKMVGLCLRDDLRARSWRDAEAKDWSGDKTKALMWSYQHFPAHLQRCFSYLNLYPKSYDFKDLELFQLWMAQGFIKPSAEQNKRMEDVGSQYLEELVSRFYIQRRDSYYTLHELLYDLAKEVSRNDCLRMEGNRQTKIPSTIRHLWIPANKLNENKEDICKLRKLRTLFVTKGESVASEENVASDIFKSLKKLRVLVLKLNLENLAEFISEMKHLRVLQVPGSSKFVLPESVCTLYQLQALRINSASSLPKCLNNLVSLRYLEANFGLVSRIPHIGRLTLLQRLEIFEVRKEKGYELDQLQNLNELRGSLHIQNLENVESKESAIAANLKEKKHLEELQLVWIDDEDNVNSNSDDEVLEGLQVPPFLTGLRLDGYRGRSYPSCWPDYQTSNIENLVLWKCRMLEELPPMDRLYPSCRSLLLLHLPRLKALHALPPKLTEVTILNAPFLTFVTKEDQQTSREEKRSAGEVVMRKRTPEGFLREHKRDLVDDEREMREFIAAMNGSDNESRTPEHITTVWERWLWLHERKMELIYDRQNEAKLLLPSTLTKLCLSGCNIANHALSACLQNLTSLTYLSLSNIKTITHLPSADVLRNLRALKQVVLEDCWALTSLGGTGSLPCLKWLDLSRCPRLDGGTASLPSSLESINFNHCADVDDILADADLPHLRRLFIYRCDMQTLSLQLGNLQSLLHLEIFECPGLSLLADMQKLLSLQYLSVMHCPNLQQVMNLPRSLPGVNIHCCRILEQSIKTDPLSGKPMLDGIPVDDIPSLLYSL